MAYHSSIEWTESSWNPVTGCTKISEGCKNCYAERMALRLQAMKNLRYRNGFEITIHKDVLEYPLKWKTPQMIFVNSMSDLFHEKIPDDFIIDVFEVMNNSDRHIFQVLTKRSDRLLSLSKKLTWSDNIWMGVTVESDKYIERIKDLLNVTSRVKFISFEPLLSDIAVHDLVGIDWVIVGGESGPFARPMHSEWARNIRDICISQNIAFFFKQWGGKRKKVNGRHLDGKLWSQFPPILEGLRL